MKRIVASGYDSIMESNDGLFKLVKYESTGRDNIHYTALEVKSGELARKFVVEIRLNSTVFQDEDFQYKYYPEGTYVAHGMSMTHENLEDTEDYIYVLREAVEFARKVNAYIRKHPEWNAEYKTAR